jgi:glucosyl-3-phosphoglycerate synthase
VIVVVPARNEARRIGACLAALAAQRGQRFAVIVVLDDCRDETGQIAAEVAAVHRLDLQLLAGPGRGSGAARRTGMELAAGRLLAGGRSDGLIASTDADTRPEHDWLARQLAHVRAGALAIGGLVDLDAEELAALPPGVARRRDAEAPVRLARVRATEPDAEHHHFAGASLAVRADAYRAVGGIDPLGALEDEAFATRLRARGVAITRPADVRVRTSARTNGRSTHGLAADLRIAAWLEANRQADCPNDVMLRARWPRHRHSTRG